MENLNLEDSFKKIVEEAKKLSLSKEQKDLAKSHLLSFMEEYPTAQAPGMGGFYAKFMGLVASKPVIRYGYFSLASLAIVMFFGSGIAFAAQQSLPGDFLYPIKTGFNEKLVAVTLISDHAKAEYDINLAQLRLEEIETASAQGRLSSTGSQEAKMLLDDHIKDIQQRIININNNEDSRLAIELNSKLEATLNAHAGVLGALAGKSQGAASAAIGGVASDIKDRADQVMARRQDDESKLRAKANVDLGVTAAKKREEASTALKNTADVLASKKGDISAASYTKAQADLAAANTLMASGDVNVEGKDYNSAFLMFQAVLRKSLEINLYVSGEASLKTQLLPMLPNTSTQNVDVEKGDESLKADVQGSVNNIIKLK